MLQPLPFVDDDFYDDDDDDDFYDDDDDDFDDDAFEADVFDDYVLDDDDDDFDAADALEFKGMRFINHEAPSDLNLLALFENGEDGYTFCEPDLTIEDEAAALAYFMALIDDINPYNINDIDLSDAATTKYIVLSHPEFDFNLTLTAEAFPYGTPQRWFIWTSISDR